VIRVEKFRYFDLHWQKSKSHMVVICKLRSLSIYFKSYNFVIEEYTMTYYYVL
jgi:hypothetical protein